MQRFGEISVGNDACEDLLESHTHDPVRHRLRVTQMMWKTHCSDVKYESEGQPTLPVNCDGDVGPPETGELKLLENIAHFLPPFQSLHVRS